MLRLKNLGSGSSGNATLIEGSDGLHTRRLLVDCGLFQGAETSAEGKSAADRMAIEFPLDTIKALVATHVHIDHVGRIPYLLAAGFKALKPSFQPRTVRLQGPEALISQVDKVTGLVPVGGLDESFTVTQNTTTSISGLGVPVPDW